MQTNNLEIRKELKKLLNITYDSRLIEITKTIRVINDERGFSISFRGTNSFVLVVPNSFQNPVVSRRGQEYPNVSGLLLEKIKDNPERSILQLTIALRDDLLRILRL